MKHQPIWKINTPQVIPRIIRRFTKNLKNHCKKLNTKNISHPPTARDIDQFEKDNLDIAISIFTYNGFKKVNAEENNDDDDLEDICLNDLDIDYDENKTDNTSNSDTSENNVSKSKKTTKRILITDIRIFKYAGQREHTVNLLVIVEGDKKHYLYIRSISRSFRGSRYDRGMFYCDRCYYSKSLRVLSKKGEDDIFKFKDYYKKLMQSFMITFDFETYTDRSGNISPYSFAMFTHCIFNNEKSKLTKYTGSNILDKFFEHLIKHIKRIDECKEKLDPLSNPDVYNINPEFAICSICNKIIDDQYNAYRYRYYCRKTGYLLRFKHKECIDLLRRTNEITIFSHNGSRFDLRLIIKHITKQCKANLIKCIAHNKETFYSLMIYNFCNKNIRLKFIDSSRHLPFSLDKLTTYLSNKYNPNIDNSEKTINTLKENFLYMYQIFGDDFL